MFGHVSQARRTRQGITLPELLIGLAITSTIITLAGSSASGIVGGIREGECSAYVDKIRRAEIMHMLQADEAVALMTGPNGDLTVVNEEYRKGWQTLELPSPESIKGRFLATPTEDGFEVHAWCDTERNGKPVHYVATKTQPAALDPVSKTQN